MQIVLQLFPAQAPALARTLFRRNALLGSQRTCGKVFLWLIAEAEVRTRESRPSAVSEDPPCTHCGKQA